MRKRELALLGVAAGTAAAVGAAAYATRRWAAAHDPTGGEPLRVPEGREVKVETADGAVLEALVAGPDGAPTYVLSHCWTGDRRIWGPVACRLVDAGNRVVLYHQRGHAGSVAGADGYTIEALGDDVRAVLEQLDLREVVLAGHSMGGMSVMSFATRHEAVLADRVRRVVLVATAASQVGAGRGELVDRVATKVLASRRVERAIRHPRVGHVLVRGSVGPKPVLSHLQAVRDTFVATPAEARAGFFTAMCAMDLTEGLREVRVPVTVVVGTHDQLTPVRSARRIAECVTDARLEVLDGLGHMLPIEAPDRITEILLEDRS